MIFLPECSALYTLRIREASCPTGSPAITKIIVLDPDPHLYLLMDPDPHLYLLMDPDPHSIGILVPYLQRSIQQKNANKSTQNNRHRKKYEITARGEIQ